LDHARAPNDTYDVARANDGMGIVWAARLLGIRFPERLPRVVIMEGVIMLLICCGNTC
jgi:hypothetical protein